MEKPRKLKGAGVSICLGQGSVAPFSTYVHPILPSVILSSEALELVFGSGASIKEEIGIALWKGSAIREDSLSK